MEWRCSCFLPHPVLTPSPAPPPRPETHHALSRHAGAIGVLGPAAGGGSVAEAPSSRRSGVRTARKAAAVPARRLRRRVLAARPPRPVAVCVRAAAGKNPDIGVRGCPSWYVGVFGVVRMTTFEYFPSLGSVEGRLGSVR